MNSICSIFVYGTLKHDSLRASLWPFPPRRISSAEIRGRLFDLGPYPAVCEGNDRIGGELWDISADEMAETMRVLDRIEGYQQDDEENLYVRRVVDCWSANARDPIPSFVYFYADEAWAARHRQVQPNRDGLCVWHAPPGSRPITELD